MRCGATTVASAFCVFAHFVLHTFCEPRVSEGCAGGSCAALQRSHLQLNMDNLRARRVMEDDEGKSIAQHEKAPRFKAVAEVASDSPGRDNGALLDVEPLMEFFGFGSCRFDGWKAVKQEGHVVWTKDECKDSCADDPKCVMCDVANPYYKVSKYLYYVCQHYYGEGDNFHPVYVVNRKDERCFGIYNRVGRRRGTSPTSRPTPQPTARLPGSVEVAIMGSTRNKKCVFQSNTICDADAGNPGKRVNGRWAGDTFEITREGDKICARRKDATGGWMMHLRLICSPLPGYDVNDCHCTGYLNQYKCNDGWEAFCATWEECYAKERSFKKGNWPDGCRQQK